MWQLHDGLIREGIESKVLLPKWQRLSDASALFKISHQIAYLASIFLILILAPRRPRTVVTLDAPSGLHLVGQVASRQPWLRLTHILWVMDLYRFTEAGDSFSRLKKLQKYLDALAFKQGQNIVVLGKCMADFLGKSFSVESSVIPIWQDPQQYGVCDVDRVRDLRQRLGLEGKLVVLYSGTARSMHPLQALLEAATELQQDNRIAFVIVGRGPEIERIRSEAKLEPHLNLTVLDYVSANDVPNVAELGDIHVVSLSEDATGTCVPSKGYAAMAAGKPILYIGSPDGQLAVDIASSNSGVVVSGDAGSAIAEHLVEILHDDAHRISQGNNGKDFFRANRTSNNGTTSWMRYMASL